MSAAKLHLKPTRERLWLRVAAAVFSGSVARAETPPAANPRTCVGRHDGGPRRCPGGPRPGRLLALVAAVACVSVGAPIVAQKTPAISGEALAATVQTLAAPGFEGRRTGTPGNARARAWIVERFHEAGLESIGPSFERPFRFTPRSARRESQDPSGPSAGGVNVVGLCKGSGATDNGAMVITAHYDHLGVRDGAIFHGADDNASGVAVLLELARRCRTSPWTHDAVFVAFDAEEQGLQGAKAFVATPPLPKDRLALNINLDMVSRSAGRELYVAGTSHRPALRAVLEPVAAEARVKVLFGHDTGGGTNDWTSQSDHGAFHAAGIPFVYFGVEDHPDYHKATDTADKIDMGFFADAAAAILDAVTALDRALPLPR